MSFMKMLTALNSNLQKELGGQHYFIIESMQYEKEYFPCNISKLNYC